MEKWYCFVNSKTCNDDNQLKLQEVGETNMWGEDMLTTHWAYKYQIIWEK